MTLEDLYRLLRIGHVQAQGIVETIAEPLVVLDDDFFVITANPAFYALFRTNRDETIDKNLFKLGSGQWLDPGLEKLLAKVIPRSAAIVGYEVTADFPHLGTRTMLLSARRLIHPDNNSLQMLVVFEDVTDSRKREAGQDLMIGELRHRLKNLLSVSSSLARQMSVEGLSAGEYRDAFLSRLEMLVDAELLLLNPNQSQVKVLLAKVLSQYGSKITITAGPDLKLVKSHAASLGMIIHELATNAAKYGALSRAEGHVHVGWTVDAEQFLIIDWREEGGPAVVPPTRTGFGGRLIRHAAQNTLRGTIEMNFAPGGLEVHIAVPVPSLA